MCRGQSVLFAARRFVHERLRLLLQRLFWRRLHGHRWRHLREQRRALQRRLWPGVLQRADLRVERPLSVERRWHHLPRLESNLLGVVAVLCRAVVQRRLLHLGADLRGCGPAVFDVGRLLLRAHVQQQRFLRDARHLQTDGWQLHRRQPVLQRAQLQQRGVRRGPDVPSDGQHLHRQQSVLQRADLQQRNVRRATRLSR